MASPACDAVCVAVRLVSELPRLIRMRASSREFERTWYCRSEWRVWVSRVSKMYFTRRCY